MNEFDPEFDIAAALSSSEPNLLKLVAHVREAIEKTYAIPGSTPEMTAHVRSHALETIARMLYSMGTDGHMEALAGTATTAISILIDIELPDPRTIDHIAELAETMDADLDESIDEFLRVWDEKGLDVATRSFYAVNASVQNSISVPIVATIALRRMAAMRRAAR